MGEMLGKKADAFQVGQLGFRRLRFPSGHKAPLVAMFATITAIV